MLRKSNEDTIFVFYGLEQDLPAERPDRRFLGADDPNASLGRRDRGLLKEASDTAAYGALRGSTRTNDIIWKSCKDCSARLALLPLRSPTKASGPTSIGLGQMFEPEPLQQPPVPNPQSPITLSKVINKAMRAETERSITICALALKRYSVQVWEAASWTRFTCAGVRGVGAG